MTSTPNSDGTAETAAAGIAGALTDLTEETRALVRSEIEQARREVWDKAQAAAPGLAFAGAAGVLGVFAAASSYRATLRLLERWLPAGVAAVVATVAYGAAAGAAALAARRRLVEVPAPFPTETVRHTGAVVVEAADQARDI